MDGVLHTHFWALILVQTRIRLKGFFIRKGLLLFFCALSAIFFANSPWAKAYEAFWQHSFLHHSLHQWINDALMSIFFFVVGLELKREVLVGEISTKRKAFLPIAAALGGMVVPALIYAAFNWGTPAIRGWGIPMATDIAFALGVLSLVGRKASASSKVFLTALATIDDLGAILVIAVFYVYNLSVINLGFALIALVILVILNQIKVKNLGLYLVCGVFLWFAILKSGVHPTIAGVLLALVIPRNAQYLERLEQRLNPWVNFAILPVFA